MTEEKRQFPRHPSSIPIEIVKYGDNEDILYVKNISYGGLAFISQHAYPPDTLLKIRVLTHSPFELTCKVAWCRPEQQQGFEIGVEFTARRSMWADQLALVEIYKKLLAENQVIP